MLKLIVLGTLAVATIVPAAAMAYTTDTVTYTGLGDQTGTQFDIVTLNGVTGSAPGPGTYLANTVDFTVGLNSNTGGTYTGSFTDTATVGGSPVSYTVPYTLTVSTADSITIGGNDLFYQGYKIHFNTLTFTDIGAGTVTGDLTATVSVPEPATWAMMVTGFGLVGLGVRRRRPTAVAA